MYAVIRRYNAHPGMAERIVQRVQADFVPQLSRIPSFVAYYVVSADDGGMVSMSIFEDRAGAEEANHLSSDWVRRNVATMVKTAPVIVTGTVVVQHHQHAMRG